MKTSYKKIITHTLVALVVCFPLVSFAAIDYWPIVQCDGSTDKPCNFEAFIEMITRIINIFITFAVTIATITFAWAGARILLHPDSSGERDAAKEMFRKSIYGIVFLLGSWVIVYVIMKELATGTDSDYLRFLR